MLLGYSISASINASNETVSLLLLKHPAQSSAALTPMLDDSDRTLREPEDSTTIVDYDSDSRFSDSDPTSAELSKDHLRESE